MHPDLIKAHYEQTAAAETFWRSAHMDAETDRDRNEYGWLWMHFREARERLGEMVETVAPDKTERVSA